jgi:hypothetical protein
MWLSVAHNTPMSQRQSMPWSQICTSGLYNILHRFCTARCRSICFCRQFHFFQSFLVIEPPLIRSNCHHLILKNRSQMVVLLTRLRSTKVASLDKHTRCCKCDMAQIVIYIAVNHFSKKRKGILWTIQPKIGFSKLVVRPTSHGLGFQNGHP